MRSPCVKVCRVKEGRCLGCLRTIEQITNWTKYSEQQRETLMKELNRGPAETED